MPTFDPNQERHRGSAWAITPDGREFRDLNRNGRMDPFEDPELAPGTRAEDLLRRLSLAEKVGLMFQSVANISPSGHTADDVAQESRPTARSVVSERFVNHVNVQAIPDPVSTARWANELQEIAEQTPHGIPVTLSSDPRHSFIENMGASFRSEYFSAWPEPIGLAAIGNPEAVREFAEEARREYVAVGIRSSLHPTLDVATEPRWARQYSTFGSDPEAVAAFGEAYVDGFQGESVGVGSVACMAKHFPGGGPQLDGEDPHFPYGREQVYPGEMFDAHLLPFRRAIKRGVSAIMLYYGMPVGLVRNGVAIEEVGFAYNKQIVSGILRDELGFQGVISTDWGLVRDSQLNGRRLPARAWGVEHLSIPERVARIVDAGCDQLGGENDPAMLLSLVEGGVIAEARIDESVRRILRVKFELGLFDDPYVDEQRALSESGRPEAIAAGRRAQSGSIVVLERGTPSILPLPRESRIFAPGIDAALLASYGMTAADDPTAADVALLRLATPYEHRDTYMLEASFHAGSLEFPEATLDEIEAIAMHTRVVLDIGLDRPAILTPLVDIAHAIVASFGSSDEALLDALTAIVRPIGRLPFELPRSMAGVLASRPDVPNDSGNPLFPVGHGLAASDEWTRTPLHELKGL